MTDTPPPDEAKQAETQPLVRSLYVREGMGLEFDRVSFFSDAVYAIAMTLLVVDLGMPKNADAPGAMAQALSERLTPILGFFIGFIVLGRYWLAHHQFFASLRSVDRRFISLNLVYLAFVGFSPFPVGLISEYEDQTLSFVIFAATMGAISGMEVLMFLYASRHDQLRRPLSRDAERFALLASGLPVAVIVASMPLSVFSPTLALLSWLLIIPIGNWLDRRTPAEICALFEG